MNLNELQQYSDQVCEHFGMKKIPIVINRKLKRYSGLYKGNEIELSEYYGKNLSTLIHELAHHLKHHRYEKRVPGYFKMEMWPKMILDHVDKKGKKWYAPKGELHPIYIIKGTIHGKQFKECLRKIIFDFDKIESTYS